MKRFHLVFIAIMCFFIAACGQSDAKDSHGNGISLKDYSGKWVLINYWATWCNPCVKQLATLENIATTHNKTVAVLGVNFNGLPDETLNQVAKDNHITFPLLSTFPLVKINQTQVSDVPVTFVLDPQGKLVATLKGPQTEQAYLTAIHAQ